jgi:hypothetical protein
LLLILFTHHPPTEGPAFRTRYIACKQGVFLPNLPPPRAPTGCTALERVEWVFRENNRAIGEDASDETRGTRAGTKMGGMRASMLLAIAGRRRSMWSGKWV